MSGSVIEGGLMPPLVRSFLDASIAVLALGILVFLPTLWPRNRRPNEELAREQKARS